MSDLNKVLLIGRVVEDPTDASTTEEKACCVLVRTGAKTDNVVDHCVNVYGHAAENCLTHLKKNRLVYVEGRLLASGAIHATMINFLGETSLPRSNHL